mgnify:FL=1|jgi:hypothetical protein
MIKNNNFLLFNNSLVLGYYFSYDKEVEKSSDDERQKKIVMLKYTYEQVLSDQAEQVNTKRNNTNNLTAYGQKMINDSNIINMIPKNKDIRAV